MTSKGCLANLRRIAGYGPQCAALSEYLYTAAQTANIMRTSRRSIHHSWPRAMATVNQVPLEEISRAETGMSMENTGDSPKPVITIPSAHVVTTIYDFPTMEPLRFAYYPESHLHLPLRRDLLHRAVIFEGDSARSGTASTKWRDDVHGSHKKLYQQKGMGKARVGDKQSPIRRGGGIAFGPKPRDFSTKLNKKMYDIAWRTALSYRYRRGELLVVDRIGDEKTHAEWWLKQIFEANGWGNKDGRSLLIARAKGPSNEKFFKGMEKMGAEGKIVDTRGADVKNMLEMGRIIIEQRALNAILKAHSSDLVPTLQSVWNPETAVGGMV